ncbi:Nurim [Lamellibrachia satsuma]|nr:Nurim [Lamellibrachia satsuma]
MACFTTAIQLAVFLSSQSISSTLSWGIELSENTCNDTGVWWTLLQNAALLLVFVLQHSLMATDWWKNFMSTFHVKVIERPIYVIATAYALQTLIINWHSLSHAAVWFVDTSHGRPVLWTFFFLLHLSAWLIVYGSALTMDIAELTGVKQVYYYSLGLGYPLQYKSRRAQSLYGHMRHPGTCCLLVIMWVHPVMTLGRFLLALSWSFYLILGNQVTGDDYVYVEEQISRKRWSWSSSGLMTPT